MKVGVLSRFRGTAFGELEGARFRLETVKNGTMNWAHSESLDSALLLYMETLEDHLTLCKQKE